jgi:acyl-coenzyme A synthetase/AMP-(fatty) acid ligase
VTKDREQRIIRHDPDQVVAWKKGEALTAERFLQDVAQAVESLPQKRYVFNLCEDRYPFMVGFAAALRRKQITLMPPNATAGAVNGLVEEYPDSYCLVDKTNKEIKVPQIPYADLMSDKKTEAVIPLTIDPDQTAAILFTSGSTGKPKMNLKNWRTLSGEAVLALNHFPFLSRGIRTIVATVPAQHMYGLATSIFFPWQGAIAVESGRPFFPADICAALSRLPEPRVLITTPLHLRACVTAGLEWPSIDFIISATAPLADSLATDVERALKTEVMEIYGSTETGSIASRRTIEDSVWRLYQGISITPHEEGCEVNGGHLMDRVTLNDRIQHDAEGRFHLLGRDSDILKIAGKRASLRDLNHKLLEIPGVVDGVFLPPEDESSRNQRLSALVVAPSMSKREILDILAKTIDEVFLPRPLYLVETLPRNSTGKLPRKELDKLLRSLKNKH